MELQKITSYQVQNHAIERVFASYMLGEISRKKYSECVDYLLSL